MAGPFIAPPGWTPPKPGHTQGYKDWRTGQQGEGNPMSTGGFWQQGTGPFAQGGHMGGIDPSFFSAPGAYEAMSERQAALNANFQRGISALDQQLQQGGGFQNMLMADYTNPQALTAQELQLQRNMLAETEAGRRTNTLRNFDQRTNASGFGNSMGAIQGRAQIEGESAGRLQRGYNELALANADRRTQVKFQAAALLMQRFNMNAQLAMQIAEMWARKNEDAIVKPPQGGFTGEPQPLNTVPQ